MLWVAVSEMVRFHRWLMVSEVRDSQISEIIEASTGDLLEVKTCKSSRPSVTLICDILDLGTEVSPVEKK